MKDGVGDSASCFTACVGQASVTDSHPVVTPALKGEERQGKRGRAP